MPRERAAQFLKSFADALHPSDIVIVGIHGWNLEANHHVTYDDQKMGIQRFYRDGLKHDNKVLGNGVSIDAEGNDQNGLYQVFVSPERNIDDKSFHSKANEPITFENVVRYTSRQQAESWSDTGLALRFSYTDDDSCYSELCRSLHTLSRLIIVIRYQYSLSRSNAP